jgi:hypothetical protein
LKNYLFAIHFAGSALAVLLFFTGCGGSGAVPSIPTHDSSSTPAKNPVLGTRGSADLDELARLYMQSLVSARFDFLKEKAFPFPIDLEQVSSQLEMPIADFETRMEQSFASTRAAGETAGIIWGKTHILTTSILKETQDKIEFATLDILVTSDGHEYVFKARCVRINFVWYIIGGLELDTQSQGT